MRVMIVPIVKKKGLNPKVSANYRPIAIASTLSNILELIILHKYGKYLSTTDDQLGYKKGVGTEFTVYALKQVAHHYLRNDCPVYVVFMDALKAFDKVNHFTLLKKLCDRKMPAIIISLRGYWFRSQLFVVR